MRFKIANTKNYLTYIGRLFNPIIVWEKTAGIRNKIKHYISLDKNKFKYKKHIDHPVIYVLCTDDNFPIGGVKYLYKHVVVLNENGFHAVILHKKQGFRCTWFDNKTQVTCRDVIKIKHSDYLVIPEMFCSSYPLIEQGIRKVIISQNAHYTFNCHSLDQYDLKSSYMEKDITNVFCTSLHIEKYINYVFPNLKTFRGHYGINANLFQYNENKEKIIAYMPRKLPKEALQVINLLKFRGALKGWKLQEIDNLKETEVAEILKKSLIFISLSDREGFGLPPVEAMACGCLVIGCHGIGGREYFKEEFSYAVETSDMLSLTMKVEQAIKEYGADPEAFLRKTKLASEFVLSTYSQAREEFDIVKFWKQLTEANVS